MRKRLLALALLAGCTTAGAPALHSPLATVRDEAHVCLDGGGAALAVGAAVQLVRASCAPLNAKSAVVRCTPVAVADGEIVRVGGDGCAEVRVRAGHVAPGERVAIVAAR